MKGRTNMLRTSWLVSCVVFTVAAPCPAQQSPSINEILELAMHDYQDSEAELSKNPNYRAHKRGDEKLRLGDYSAALREFEKAISLQPGDRVAYLKKGEALMLSGRPAEAIVAYKKSIELSNPGDVWLWAPQLQMGAALGVLGRFDEAEQSFSRSLALYPTAQGYTGRANTILNQPDMLDERQYEKAFDDLNASLKLAPKIAHTWVTKGILLMRLNYEADEPHLDEACRALEQACRLGECKTLEQFKECKP
jgi:tetratricopeptide (TPR) repeat protein